MKSINYITSLTLKYSVNLLVKPRLSSSIFHFLSSTAAAVPLAYSLKPKASIRPIGRIVTCTFLSSVCLTLLHPVSTFAMDSKMEVEATKKLVSGIKRVIGIDQEAVAEGNVEAAAVSTGINAQQVSTSSSSSLKRDRTSFSAASEYSQIAKVELKRQQAQTKYEEALEKGNQELAALWRDVISQSEKAVEYYEKSAEAAIVGNANEKWRWNNAAKALESSVECLESAAQAFEKAAIVTTQSNQQLAVLWKNIMIRHQEASVYYQKTADAIAKNSEEKNQWDAAAKRIRTSASSLELTAKAFEKTIIVVTPSNQELVALWQEITIQYQEAAEYYRKSAEVTIIGSTTTKWYTLEEAAEKISSTVLCLESAVKSVENASIAITRSNQPLAVLWQKIAIQYQEEADYCRKSTEAIINGTNAWKWDQRAERIHTIILSLKFAAESVEKVAIATAQGNQSLAAFWQKIAIQHQEEVEYYRKYSEAAAIENWNEGNQWYKAAQNINSSISCLTLAVEALEKAAIASAQNNLPLAALWQETITQYQEVAKCYQQSAEAIATGNTEDERRLKEATEVINYNISRLKSAPEIVQEATKKAVEYYQKAAEAGTVGNADEEWQWKEAARNIESSESCLKSAAEAFEKAVIATTQNNQPVAILWQKIALQYQEAAEYHRKSAEAVATGNAEEMGELRKILNKHGIKVSSLSLNFITSITSEAVNSMRKMERFSNGARALSISISYFKSTIEALEKADRLLSKLAYADEVQGVDGAQKLSVQKLLDASSTGATKQFAAEVEFGKKSNVATTKGLQAVVTSWEKVARARQDIAELYQKIVKNVAAGEDEDLDWKMWFAAEFECEESSEKYALERAIQLEKEAATAALEATTVPQQAK